MKIVLVLLIAAFTSINGLDTRQNIACQDSTLTVTCGRGEYLEIVGGNYGRTNVDICVRDINIDCHSPQSLAYMRKKCDGWQSCTLSATNQEMGNPCISVNKYLEVYYKCIKGEPKCNDAEYSCKNSVCIFREKVCDGVKDCSEGEDEANCKEYCMKNEFSCAWDGMQICVPKSKVCDGVNNCDGGVDEVDCKYPQQTICQSATGSITCNSGASIKIISGFWGIEDDATHCAATDNTIRDCSLPNAKHYLQQLCDHKQSCIIPADNTVFPENPCEGYLKYAKIVYTCWAEYEIIESCQHNWLTINNCNPGEIIRVVRGFYGRKNPTRCTKGRDPRIYMANPNDLKCSATRAHEIISNICNFKQSCSFKVENAQLTDPCESIYKYAEVRYQCWPVPKLYKSI